MKLSYRSLGIGYRTEAIMENRRKSELGRFGETVVFERLVQNGYSCTYLGGTNRCFDIEAYKDGRRLLISVKTRNHTTYMGDIKQDYYNLFFSRNPRDRYAVVNAAFEIAQSRGAIPLGPSNFASIDCQRSTQKTTGWCLSLIVPMAV